MGISMIFLISLYLFQLLCWFGLVALGFFIGVAEGRGDRRRALTIAAVGGTAMLLFIAAVTLSPMLLLGMSSFKNFN